MTAWITGYIVVGFLIQLFLWKKMKIHWGHETLDTKFLIASVPIIWPATLLFILVVWVRT